MNHFTPFLPQGVLLRLPPISDERARDLEERLLRSFRMRERIQRRAEAAMLVVGGFVFAFTYMAQVSP
ncbi:hypothetical protein ELI38_20265 [Rhizobium leguminosarum]|uniref:hypothetical protein n=1 Tax=Rhizobium leguminosarum TaxID=384 RepID=UPI0010305EE4|nr:hypothetical protein [Rhizobium leguminosarum]TAU98143.1 hypothetical protein ELI38_20265 [Rhizobium leguminosarum]